MSEVEFETFNIFIKGVQIKIPFHIYSRDATIF